MVPTTPQVMIDSSESSGPFTTGVPFRPHTGRWTGVPFRPYTGLGSGNAFACRQIGSRHRSHFRKSKSKSVTRGQARGPRASGDKPTTGIPKVEGRTPKVEGKSPKVRGKRARETQRQLEARQR